MRKIRWAYCARCEHCKKRGSMDGTPNISTAADIRDGVYDNVCMEQTDPDGGPLLIDRWMKDSLEFSLNTGDLKIIGSVILRWDEGEQKYRKLTTLSKYAEQFLWEPRQCQFFRVARKFKKHENKSKPSNVVQYFYNPNTNNYEVV